MISSSNDYQKLQARAQNVYVFISGCRSLSQSLGVSFFSSWAWPKTHICRWNCHLTCHGSRDKNRLDKFWSDQEVLHDYNTDLHGIGNRSILQYYVTSICDFKYISRIQRQASQTCFRLLHDDDADDDVDDVVVFLNCLRPSCLFVICLLLLIETAHLCTGGRMLT